MQYCICIHTDIFFKRTPHAKGLEEVQSLIVEHTDRAIVFGINTIPFKNDLDSLVAGGICTNSGSPTLDGIDDQAAQVAEILSTLQKFSSIELVELR